MATIGLDHVVYSKITEAEQTGYETYDSTIKTLAKAITANLTVNVVEATLYADDGTAEKVIEFKDGKIPLNVADIGASVAADLLDAKVDSNGVVIATSEDSPKPVAIGFRAKRPNGKYRYFWLYRVKFGIPGTNLTTKGENITFSTPTIEGTIMRRNKPDANNNHPWKAEVTDGETGVDATTITNWFTSVYEPTYPAQTPAQTPAQQGNS